MRNISSTSSSDAISTHILSTNNVQHSFFTAPHYWRPLYLPGLHSYPRLFQRAMHSDDRPYACDECDFRSAQSGHLAKHVSTVHGGERPYGMRFCATRFSDFFWCPSSYHFCLCLIRYFVDTICTYHIFSPPFFTLSFSLSLAPRYAHIVCSPAAPCIHTHAHAPPNSLRPVRLPQHAVRPPDRAQARRALGRAAVRVRVVPLRQVRFKDSRQLL